MNIRKGGYKRLGWLRTISRSHVDLNRSCIVDATGRSQNKPLGNYRTTTIVDRTVRVSDFKASMPWKAIERVNLSIDDTGFELIGKEKVLKSDISVSVSTSETSNTVKQIDNATTHF